MPLVCQISQKFPFCISVSNDSVEACAISLVSGFFTQETLFVGNTLVILHFTNRLSLESFYNIHTCEEFKFRVFLNQSNSDLSKKFTEMHRNDKQKNKFVLVIEAVKRGIANTTQWNFESKSNLGEIYAIKVDQHRFYTLVTKSGGYRELFICRYGKKESQQNSKKLTDTINSISKIQLEKLLS